MTGLLLITALAMSAGGAATFLIQRGRILAGVDTVLLSRVDEARQVVLGASNSKAADSAADVKPEPFRSSSTALEAVIGRVLPATHEDSLGILNGKAKFVPGVATDFHLEDMPGFVARVVGEVADGGVYLGTAASPHGAVRYVAAPLTVAGSTDRGIYVTAVDLDAQLADLTAAFQTYWLVMAIAVALVASLGWFIAGRLLRPIHDLRTTANRITSGNRNERIPVVGHDDLSLLSTTVNDMLDRLDGAMTSQRQLLDDVRHELNTPITIVRGHLELLDAENPREVRATRALAIEELDRVAALVQDLAFLAESERSAPERRVVDVSDFTEQVFAKVRILPGHRWALASVARTTAVIDPARITQAWMQLVDNAAKYSPADSEITLGSVQRPDGIEFWVADHGGGVPPEARERIFERFGRADTGRGIAGSGLGLPIVKAIALAHGGRVELLSSNEGARFALVLPQNVENEAFTVQGGTNHE